MEGAAALGGDAVGEGAASERWIGDNLRQPSRDIEDIELSIRSDFCVVICGNLGNGIGDAIWFVGE